MTATITTGQENDAAASGKVYVFATAHGEEVHVSKAQGAGIRRLGIVSVEDAVRGGMREVCGAWTTANYEIPNGVVVKVFAHVRKRHNDVPTSQCVFLKSDNNADLVRFDIEMTGLARCVKTHVQIIGKFNVLSKEQAEAAGYKAIPSHFRHQFMPVDHRESLVSMNILERGVRQRRRMPTPDVVVENVTVGSSGRHRVTGRNRGMEREIAQAGQTRPTPRSGRTRRGREPISEIIQRREEGLREAASRGLDTNRDAAQLVESYVSWEITIVTLRRDLEALRRRVFSQLPPEEQLRVLFSNAEQRTRATVATSPSPASQPAASHAPAAGGLQRRRRLFTK